MLGVGELNADNVSREPSVGGGWGYADPVIAAIRRVIQDAAAPTSPNFRARRRLRHGILRQDRSQPQLSDRCLLGIGSGSPEVR